MAISVSVANPGRISSTSVANPGRISSVGVANPGRITSVGVATPPLLTNLRQGSTSYVPDPNFVAPRYNVGGGGAPAPVYAPKLDVAAINAQARQAAEKALRQFHSTA